MKRTHILWLAAGLMLTACDSDCNSPAADSTGSATFQINVHNRYGINVSSRAENDQESGTDDVDTTLPEGIYDLKYLLADGNGHILDHHYCRLENDFSKLTLEGLKSGRYSIMFIGSCNEPISTESPADISEPWIVNKKEESPVNSVYYYKKLDFSIGFDQSPINERVELELAVAKVEVALKMENPSLFRHIKNVSVSVDGNIPASLNADGAYSGINKIADYDITDAEGNFSFTTFPTEKPVSGWVDVVSSIEGGEDFHTRYTFDGLTLRKGKVSRIEVQYRHPETESGRLYVAKNQLWRFDTDTMFMSDEPREVFYNTSLRSFYVNAPLQLRITNEGSLGVKLYSPMDVKNVKVLGRFRNISSEWVDLAYFESIPAFTDGLFELPVVKKECVFKATSGRNIRIPAQPNLTAEDLEIKFETDDEFMKKISTIDSRWYIRFSKFGADNGHPNWLHMDPMLCRHGVALVLNMAFMFASPEFSAELDTYDGILKDNAGNAINLDALRSKIRSHGGLQLGRVHRVGGLGGGQTYGLANYCYTGVYHDATAPNANPHNYARQAMFHEYGHCLGYSHSSNMTYGNKWTVLCAKIFVQLGREGKLPVPNSTDVTSLPYNR
ncbi:MAG: hypothetical protein NC248_00405 [Bacteroides sp.]|nr:hypothetical protein [Bacteroides sp.]MCM1389161.1 hypothetical protein [Bacteroides sp.]